MKTTYVRYNGATTKQAKFGRSDDPRNILNKGVEYVLVDKIIHSWHTLFILKGYEQYKFNSVCFTEL